MVCFVKNQQNTYIYLLTKYQSSSFIIHRDMECLFSTVCEKSVNIPGIITVCDDFGPVYQTKTTVCVSYTVFMLGIFEKTNLYDTYALHKNRFVLYGVYDLF
jgi:hypothetical protein